MRSLEAENVRLAKECQFLKQRKDLAESGFAKWKADSERLSTKVQELNGLLRNSFPLQLII
jgi:hypothetical protein